MATQVTVRVEPWAAVGPVLALSASTLLLTLIALSRPWYLSVDLRWLAVAAVASAGCCLALVLPQFRRHLWAFAPMLLFLITVFHLGLLVGPIFTGQYQLFADSSTAWVTTSEMRLAIWFVGMCLAAFAVGTNLVRLIGGEEQLEELTDDGFAQAASRLGAIVLAGSVVAWFAVVISLFGRRAFQVSYLDYVRATQSSVVAFINLGIALGLVLLCLDPASKRAPYGLVMFGLFAVASLSIGDRSTSMFAAAAAAVVLAYRRRMPRPAWMVPIIIGAMTVIGLVRAGRIEGLAGIAARDLLLTPVTGVAELGYTLRVVQTSFLWHGVQHEPLMHGGTYVGWPARLLQEWVFGTPLPVQDFRLMNVEIAARLGGLGGSILAETHHNFGVVGGVAIALALGVGTAWASRSVRSTFGLALLGIFAVPLFIHVRNSFAPVLFAVCLGLTLLGIARIAQRRPVPLRR